MMQIKYPILEVDLVKLSQNVKSIVDLCKHENIEITGVVKGCNASVEITEKFVEYGCSSIGSSRINQLKNLKTAGVDAPMMLLRIPMLNEILDVVRFSDISLNSEKKTLSEMNEACKLLSINHKVILMFDLGDLREGMWNEDEFVYLAEYVEYELSNIELHGIGTNLGCYGSIKPTLTNMNRLVDIAEIVERHIRRKLDVVSGGASNSLPVVLAKQMPTRINNLRIGEAILLAKDIKVYYDCDFDFMHSDTFILHAQIVELKEKPSYPVGEIFIDAFGNKPKYEDMGLQKRAILAIGKQDVGDHTKLIPVNESISVIGSSSDHLIIDVSSTKEDYKVGDIVSFTMFYQSMLYLSLSEDVNKVYNRKMHHK